MKMRKVRDNNLDGLHLGDSVEEQPSRQYNQVVRVKIGPQSNWTHANFTCVPGEEAIKHSKKKTSQAVVKMQRTCI